MKSKSFDCVQMKHEIQRRLLHQAEGMSPNQWREKTEQAILADPTLGSVWRDARRFVVSVPDPEILRRATKAAETVAREVPLGAAYLFGSHLMGRADHWSDIDVAVFAAIPEDWDLARRTEQSTRVHREVGNDIELHFFRSEDLMHPNATGFAAYVLKHGHRLKIGMDV